MSLSDEDRAALEALAKEHGVDADALIAEAEKAAEEDEQGPASKNADAAPSGGEEVKLFQYHLSFVTVRELRQKFLRLTEPFPDDGLPCVVWQMKHEKAVAGTPPADE